MGPGRRHQKFASGFVLFFVFIVFVALASSCQRSTRADVSATSGPIENIELVDDEFDFFFR